VLIMSVWQLLFISADLPFGSDIDSKFDVPLTVHRDKFLIIKPTRCTNISNLFLERNSACFGQFLCPSSGVFHCTHNSGICHSGLLTACEQEHMLLLASFQQTFITYTIVVCTVKTPDDGQRNCPKHAEFRSKNKFGILVHLVFFWGGGAVALRPNAGHGLLILEVSTSHTTMHHSR